MRALIILTLLLLAVTACAGSEAARPDTASPEAPSPTGQPAASPTPAPTPIPTPAPTPRPSPVLNLNGSFLRQGGFLIVRLLNPPLGMSAASVVFEEKLYSMIPEGELWFAVIGIPTWFEPGDYAITVIADQPIVSGVANIQPGGFAQESLTLPPSSIGLLSDPAAVQAERDTLNAVYAGFTPRRLWSGQWTVPAEGPLSDPFGLMRSINGAAPYPHTGTDIANQTGTSVAAAAAGTVALAREMYLYGNVVVVDHGAGVFTAYNHLDQILVSEGQAVSQGKLVGLMGETGFVTGPHLHWEAIVHGVRVDPMLWAVQSQEP